MIFDIVYLVKAEEKITIHPMEKSALAESQMTQAQDISIKSSGGLFGKKVHVTVK